MVVQGDLFIGLFWELAGLGGGEEGGGGETDGVLRQMLVHNRYTVGLVDGVGCATGLTDRLEVLPGREAGEDMDEELVGKGEEGGARERGCSCGTLHLAVCAHEGMSGVMLYAGSRQIKGKYSV